MGGKTEQSERARGAGLSADLALSKSLCAVLSVTFCAAVMCLLLCYAKLHTFESSALVILNASLTSSKSRVTAFFSSPVSNNNMPDTQGCKELSSKELSSRSSPDILELELN